MNSSSPVLSRPLNAVAKKLDTTPISAVKSPILVKPKQTQGGSRDLYIYFRRFENRVKFYIRMRLLFKLKERNASRGVFKTIRNAFILIVFSSRYIEGILYQYISLGQLDIVIRAN